MKLKIILIAIGILISTLGIVFNPFVIVKKSDVKRWKTNAYNDSVSVAKLSRENILQDSLLFDCHQTSDVSTQQLREQQIVLLELQKQLKQAKNNYTQANEAIAHYEQNGLMRFFVFDKKGIFKKGCYEEVFEKPDNICK